jgi:3D (Asp-Asp-Asp) domain-containing protein
MMKEIFRVVNRVGRLASVASLFSLGLLFPALRTSSAILAPQTAAEPVHWHGAEPPITHANKLHIYDEQSQIRSLFMRARQHVAHPVQSHTPSALPHPLSGRGESQVDLGAGSWMSFVATWYSPQEGEGNGLITATGTRVKTGWTVAVDPNVIPLGSLIQVQFANGQTHIYKALDTGGAIKGHRVDIFNASRTVCLKNGRQPVKVRVLLQTHLVTGAAKKRITGAKW